MALTSDQMKEMAFRNSPFLKLQDGETSPICLLVECKDVPSKQNPTQTTYQYKLEFSDSKGTVVKFLESASNKLLTKMSDLLGKQIQIKRTGLGTETQYEPTLA